MNINDDLVGAVKVAEKKFSQATTELNRAKEEAMHAQNEYQRAMRALTDACLQSGIEVCSKCKGRGVDGKVVTVMCPACNGKGFKAPVE